MLIPFPIAFFVTTFVCDLAFAQTGNLFWATANLWLLGAGLVMAGLAAVVGLIDVLGQPRIQALRDVCWHAGGNVLAVLIALYNWYLRYTAGDNVVGSTGLILHQWPDTGVRPTSTTGSEEVSMGGLPIRSVVASGRN